MPWDAARIVRAKVNDWIASAEWAGFRGGARAQVPSLPSDDPLTSNEKGVCTAYTLAEHSLVLVKGKVFVCSAVS